MTIALHSTVRIRKCALLATILAPLAAWDAADSAAEAMMLGRGDGPRGGGHHTMRHHSGMRGGGSGVAAGIGVGIGIGIASELIRRQASEPAQIYSRSTPKPEAAGRPRKPDTVARSKAKDRPVQAGKAPGGPAIATGPQPLAAPPASATPPDAPPAYTPGPPKVPALGAPVFLPRPFPDPLLVANCDDCTRLRDSVEWYEQNIVDDEKKLADNRKRVSDLESDRDRYKARLASAGSNDRLYDQQMLDNTERSIRTWKGLNASLERLIEDQKAILRDRKAQLERCLELLCPKPVAQVPRWTPPVEVRIAPPPAIRIPSSAPPPSATPVAQSGPCTDHQAELTNGKRVFHRLYVTGPGEGLAAPLERINWASQMQMMKSTLEGPGRQAEGSTSRSLDKPTAAELEAEIAKLQQLAKPCEEVTLVLKGHGWNRGLRVGEATSWAESGALTAGRLDTFVKGFGRDVSVTMIMDTCYGGSFGGQVEQSALVQVIGITTTCPSFDFPGRTELDEGIAGAIDAAAGANPDSRSTARKVKLDLAGNGWAVGR